MNIKTSLRPEQCEKVVHLLEADSPSAAAVVAFEEQVQRLRDGGLHGDIDVRGHIGGDGEPCYGLTLMLWRDLSPVLIGTVSRDGNQTALVLINRAGREPIVTSLLFG